MNSGSIILKMLLYPIDHDFHDECARRAGSTFTILKYSLFICTINNIVLTVAYPCLM